MIKTYQEVILELIQNDDEKPEKIEKKINELIEKINSPDHIENSYETLDHFLIWLTGYSIESIEKIKKGEAV